MKGFTSALVAAFAVCAIVAQPLPSAAHHCVGTFYYPGDPAPHPCSELDERERERNEASAAMQRAQAAAVAAERERLRQIQVQASLQQQREAEQAAERARLAAEAARQAFIAERNRYSAMLRGLDGSHGESLRGSSENGDQLRGDSGSDSLRTSSGNESHQPAEGQRRKALLQAGTANRLDQAACQFDGLAHHCGPALVPVPLETVPGLAAKLPHDAASFIETIPQSVRNTSAVANEIRMYAHFAQERATIENQLLHAQAAARNRPSDKTAQLKVSQLNGEFNAASIDEASAKKRLVRFSVHETHTRP